LEPLPGSAAFTAIAILRGGRLPRWLAVPCFAAWGVDIAFAILGQVRFLEWILVGLLLVFVGGASISRALLVAREARLG
jgi:hypothetical protein